MDAQYVLDAIQRVIDVDRARCAETGRLFRERTAASHTIGDIIDAVFNVADPEDARQFYASYAAYLTTLPHLSEREKVIALSNIDWFLEHWKCSCGTAGQADTEREARDELTRHEQRVGH